MYCTPTMKKTGNLLIWRSPQELQQGLNSTPCERYFIFIHVLFFFQSLLDSQRGKGVINTDFPEDKSEASSKSGSIKGRAVKKGKGRDKG